MVMKVLREVQDIVDFLKKIVIAAALGYGFWWLDQHHEELLLPVLISLTSLFVIQIFERFEDLLEDMDRLRVTQLTWIAETGGDEDSDSSDYE
mgnify:CR=1 FL=1